MGISFHEFSFLKYCQKKKSFKSLGTLGRQENFLKESKNDTSRYADKLLIESLNLKKLISYDVTDIENPDKIINFNYTIQNPDKFDAFYDDGSLQHTFNIKNVMTNISNHVKIGGTIIHVCSSNNLCGFGFYQFSPELFLNYYSKENGFINTEVFVADYDDQKNWYKVESTTNERTYINTSARLICLVRTEKYKDCEVNDLVQKNTFIHSNNDKSSLFKNKFNLKIYFKLIQLLNLFSPSLSIKLNTKLKKKNILDII